jgi:hypothetical protein
MQDSDKHSDLLRLDASNTCLKPLAVTFLTGKKVTGLGLTSLWKLAKDGRIEIVRVGRRTLITYRSLEKLLLPSDIIAAPADMFAISSSSSQGTDCCLAGAQASNRAQTGLKGSRKAVTATPQTGPPQNGHRGRPRKQPKRKATP